MSPNKSIDFRLKIAALLHDPPNKPWLLVRRESHEEKALEYIGELAGFDWIPEKVVDADRLAASVDRHVLSIVMGEKYIPGFMRCESLVLKNVVNPLFEVKLPQALSTEQVLKFKEKLKELCSVGDARLRYLLLYALYEVLWIDHDLPVGPADTRVPTHTVFDHNYATAAALNWIDGEGVKGLLVGLDVAGVQAFVASSRKLRDVWVSSYMVSALVWYTILPLVSGLGPDVVVTPSLRFNPFFLHWLLEGLCADLAKDLSEDLKRNLRKAEEYTYLGDKYLLKLKENLGIPPYACLPERATLILPEGGFKGVLKEDVIDALESRFKQGWSKLWNALRAYVEERASRKKELLWAFIVDAFEYYYSEFSDTGFHEVPPLFLRVEAVMVDHPQLNWYVYDRAYKELAKKLSLRKYKRMGPEVELRLDQLTEKAFARGLGFPRKSSRGFEYCTSCGKLPALLVLPSREGERPDEEEYGFYVYGAVENRWGSAEIEKRWRELREASARGEESLDLKTFRDWLEKQRVALQSLKVVFTPGERLCPWCFVKRVLSLEPQLFNVLLLGKDEEYAESLVTKNPSKATVRFSFPSTTDVASLRLREKLVESFEKKVLQAQTIEAQVVEFPPRLADFLRAVSSESRPWRAEVELEERIERLGLEDILKGLLKADAELLWLAGDKRVRAGWVRFLGSIGITDYLWSYFALLNADGDNISKLLMGDVSALFGVEDDSERLQKLLAALLKAWGACGLERLITALMVSDEKEEERALKQWANSLSGQLGASPAEVEQRLVDTGNLIRTILKEGKVPLSISYHFSVSSALSRAAILDAIVVSKLGGFIVYAGGDDLMAFLPVDEAASLIYASRRLFAGASLEECYTQLLSGGIKTEAKRGFIRVKGAWLPALPGVGRSYCVLVTHYLYSLHLAINHAATALESAKSKECKVCTNSCRDELRKDIVAFAYVPRGGMELVFVPQTVNRCIHIVEGLLSVDGYLEGVAAPVRAVDGLFRSVVPLFGQRLYSTSLLYDVENVDKHLVEAAGCHAWLVSQLVDFVLERNMTQDGAVKGGMVRWPELSELVEKLDRSGRKFATITMKFKNEHAHIFTAIVRSARLLKSGVR